MNADVYSGTKNQLRFLLVLEGKEVDAVPADVRAEFDTSTPSRKLTIGAGSSSIGLDPSKALEALEREGYYVTETRIRFRESGE